jgi:hypothetical protein
VQWAPWTRRSTTGGTLVHLIDPSMATPGQTTIRESAERAIRDTLRGRVVKGPVAWSPRREAVLRVLAPRHAQGRPPFLIAPTPETELLRQALRSRWYYPRTPDGRVDRSRPKKPNSPWADLGDALAYLLGWLAPMRDLGDGRLRQQFAHTMADPSPRLRDAGGGQRYAETRIIR